MSYAMYQSAFRIEKNHITKTDYSRELLMTDKVDFSNLKRPRYPIPDFVIKALEESGMMDAYRSRPAYQQNDYIGWISRAKREETRMKRLAQMINELEKGDIYMKMDYKPNK